MLTNLFRNVPLFSGLEERELQKLVTAVHEHHYPKNVTLFRIGDPGNAMFILERGLMKVTLEDKHGRKMIVRMLYPADFFGEMSLIDGMPRSATVTTLEPSDVLILPRESFVDIIEKSPNILLPMATVLSRRLRASDQLILSLAFFDVYGKAARAILTLAAAKGRATEQGTLIDLRLTQQELAELAGMSRETMTRILQAFQQAGVLRMKRGVIIIVSLEMLRHEVR